MQELNVKTQFKRSLPIAFESLINMLMTLIDTLCIAKLGLAAIGALGAMGVVINIIQMSIQTILVSNNTLIARSVGEKDNLKLGLTTGNAIIMTIAICIVTTIMIVLIQPTFPNLFQVDAICITYMTIRLIGFIPSSIVTVLSGHQRTIGKQNNVLVIRIIAVIANLIFDLLVVNMGYGVSGVAWVTVIIDTILMLYLLSVSKTTVKYQFSKQYINQLWCLFKWNFIERIVSRVDNFVFNIIVSRIGIIEYAVHTILLQIANIYEAFIQGFGDGITISVGIATGQNKKENMENTKKVAKQVIHKISIIIPIVTTIISIIIMKIALKETNAQLLFCYILPLLIIASYVTIKATYYFSILRGWKEFKFLAKRNIISSIIKIIVAIILVNTPLGVIGVWIAYLAYSVTQKVLSKNRYQKLEEDGKEEIL